ncbi:MAG: sortase [Acidimicrobiia bacterium]
MKNTPGVTRRELLTAVLPGAAIVPAAALLLGACSGGGSNDADSVAALLPGDGAGSASTSLAEATTLAPPTTMVATTLPPTTQTPTTLPPVTVPPSTLPTPAAVPADQYAPEPDVVLGRIAIERIKLDTELRQGITLTTLDKGPGHWPGTALPGGIGNMVVAGHRVTHSKPFRHIDKLQPGDAMTITAVDGGQARYLVTSSEVVDDQAVWIVNQTPEPTATIFACHPPGSARQRYVVRFALEA